VHFVKSRDGVVFHLPWEMSLSEINWIFYSSPRTDVALRIAPPQPARGFIAGHCLALGPIYFIEGVLDELLAKLSGHFFGRLVPRLAVCALFFI
jgi:hypothetical protein